MPLNDSRWALAPGVTARLILVRHGEPVAAARGRCYGKLDIRLSKRGREQTLLTARELKTAAINAIYTSTLRRARESAEIVARVLGLEIYIEERLCEIDFGEFEGLSYDQVAERYPKQYRAWMETPTEITFPGGENFMQMRRRVLQATADIRSSHVGQTVAIVAHGGVCRIILAEALQMPPRNIFSLDQSYAAVSMIDYYEQTPVVRLVNHLGYGEE
jgi:alpha-ribazole phosphatase